MRKAFVFYAPVAALFLLMFAAYFAFALGWYMVGLILAFAALALFFGVESVEFGRDYGGDDDGEE